MSRLNQLKDKLQNRKPILFSLIGNVAWSGIIQSAAKFPFDAMSFDLEHGTLSIESVEAHLRLCRRLPYRSR